MCCFKGEMSAEREKIHIDWSRRAEEGLKATCHVNVKRLAKRLPPIQ